MLFKTIVTLLSLLATGTFASSIQNLPSNEHGCTLIKRNRPAQFVVYGGKSESEFRLRLRNNESPKTSGCGDYSVEQDQDANTVRLIKGGKVLGSIKLLTGRERNGFGFDGVKKTKEGFELAIEYGSRIFYRKNFIFICRHHKFYLSKIGVDSFDRQNPAKWSKKVIRVRPTVPLEKFLITDFMLEGVVQQ